MKAARRTVDSTDNPAVLAAAVTRNNGRYNGNGREWATPPEIFEPLHAEFGFTLDACATADNAKLPRFYTEAQDGLSQSWEGERVQVWKCEWPDCAVVPYHVHMISEPSTPPQPTSACDACDGSGESAINFPDGTEASTKTPPCEKCGGSGVKSE